MSRKVAQDCYSQGCRLCQQGKWLCIFLTYLCNARCPFCPAPVKNKDLIASAFGDRPTNILDRIGNGPVAGISFSGGDPFVVFDRLAEWLTFFKQHRPNFYYWCYTNGFVATPERLKLLACSGMDEIRYNIAATGYDAPFVLEQIAFAARTFRRVAVEIPSIPSDYKKVTAVLPRLEAAGVAYLNLHQYIVPARSPHSRRFRLNRRHTVHYDARSLENTERIAQFCREKGFNIQVNNCSLKKKRNQMQLRAIRLGESNA